jgi:hypothetical protein
MFRTLIYPSSGDCDYVVELPHRSFCSRFVVCWRFGAVGFEWCPCCRLKPATRTPELDLAILRHVVTHYKYTMACPSITIKRCYVYYCIRATCFDSYRIIFRPFQNTDPYLTMFKKCAVGFQTLTFPQRTFKNLSKGLFS